MSQNRQQGGEPEVTLRDNQKNFDNKLKFKASTLTHIAEMRLKGQNQLETDFIERQFIQKNNIHYERYH